MDTMKKPVNTETFHFFNANPAGYRTGDCLTRAISFANGISWDVTIVTIALWSVKSKRTLIGGKEIDECLQEFGKWKKHPMPKHENGRRYRVWELAKELKKEKKPVIVSMANHLSVIKSGKIWDTWDCGGYSVGNYWTLEE